MSGMLVFVCLLCSTTGSPAMSNSKFCTCPLTCHFYISKEEFIFPLGESAQMSANLTPVCLFCRKWEKGLQRNWVEVNLGVDSAPREDFPRSSARADMCLWCWWDPLARPHQTAASISPRVHSCVFLCLQSCIVCCFLSYTSYFKMHYENVISNWAFHFLAVVKTCLP